MTSPETDEHCILQDDSVASEGQDDIVITGSKETWLPHRYRLFFMFFLITALVQSARASFNLALVAMVNDTAPVHVTNSSNDDQCPGTGNLNDTHQTGEFNWSGSQQNQLLSAYYYGNIILQIPGGYLSERFGGKRILTSIALLSGLCIVLTPMLAKHSFVALFVARIAVGLFTGPFFVAIMALAGKWAPKFEVTKLLGCATNGYPIGNIICYSSSGFLIQSGFLGGWPSVFYIYGGLLLLWGVVFQWLAANSPAEDDTISIEERLYIEKNTDDRDHVKYQNPPIRSLLTSPAVLSLWLVAATDGFGLFVLFTSLPFYMKYMLAYDIADNGLTMALINISPVLAIAIATPISDYVRSRGYLGTRAVRVIATLIADCGQAVVLILIAFFFECDRVAVLCMLSLGNFAYGMAAAGFMVSALDIAPMYTGTIAGIGNFLTTPMGFVSPNIVTWILGESPGREAWKKVFITTSVVLIAGSLVFAVFAKGEELEWAKVKRQTAPCGIPEEEDNLSDSGANSEDSCDNDTAHMVN